VATRTSPLKCFGPLPEKIRRPLRVGNVKDLFLRNSQDNYSRIRKPFNESAVITTRPHMFVWFEEEEICEFVILGTALANLCIGSMISE
jgi:hypothetical protein